MNLWLGFVGVVIFGLGSMCHVVVQGTDVWTRRALTRPHALSIVGWLLTAAGATVVAVVMIPALP
ncbi:hypothetical protein [Rathayibacter sp. SD072]|uniref:hypothetical protein n=1 Tax=Rathayibacter sp. SD072 TaxID=2781731 RepID=UPI001A95AF18|nr:hypothetical protein [Rathayibacter sp. SD072]MBO0984879.1 hypothetical protein [Rathayibacter sp. SD072]